MVKDEYSKDIRYTLYPYLSVFDVLKKENKFTIDTFKIII